MTTEQDREDRIASWRETRLDRPPSVLVVDDEEDFLDITELFLAADGFRIIKARSASEAMWLALHDPPDLALVDLMLPGGNGFQILRALRSEPETRSIPVFACSAAPIEDGPAVVRAGFDGHFPKPVNWPQLRDLLRKLIRARQEAE